MTDYPQPRDFLDECDALAQLVEGFVDSDFKQVTQFKDWTVNDILQHLHIWNWAVVECLRDTGPAHEFLRDVAKAVSSPGGLRQFERERLGPLEGTALRSEWVEQARSTAEAFTDADPKTRVPWAGPSMSARSAITARLMETWSHAQAIYDFLGVERVDTDRIRNIAHMGVGTFAWSHRNRGLPVPEIVPRIRLTAPSGVVWSWNEKVETDLIEGSATGFCQVVTQTRNIADTDLSVAGPVAGRWMSIAQCFAGPPMDPPPAGTRGPKIRNEM